MRALRIRLAEITESIRLLRALLDALPEGGTRGAAAAGSGEGIGVPRGSAATSGTGCGSMAG